ncbi:RTA1 domain protein [Corynespora cassiicola Philippines]|uniref:RTA1 domain protein n=1 Tax=Corynespora cassiicola Philippines TaxID=1448308 RepID=A0A2T2P474_CORCC|nr:RTA1 domain protein [Corynespora cassiicola Philippines]
MPDGRPVQGSLYFYAPNKISPACFAFAFAVSGLLHLWQCIRYKSFKVTGLHPFCCLLFTVGFALREYGAFDYDHLNVYLVSTILIYSAPPILELANYHVLGRILYYVPYFSPLHPGRTLTTFGAVSFVVEVMNGIGVSYIANPNIPENLTDLGHILMKTSLIIQVVVITTFCIIAAIFHRKCTSAGLKSRKVQGPLWTMYASMALILVRTIYRIVEHFGASSIPTDPPADWDPMSLSPIIRYEWYFYVFEAMLMLFNSVLWNIRHPRRYLPEDYHVYLAQDGKTELQGPGWKDDQPWLMTFIDPCGITAALTKKGRSKKEKPFWEENGFENMPLDTLY